MTVRLSRLAAVLGCSLLLVACGSSAGPSSSAGSPSAPAASPAATPSTAPSIGPSVVPSSSPPASNVVLKVTSEGGFINPVASLNALPTVTVYSDGRIFTPGPVDAIAPGPLLAPLDVRDVGPAGAAQIEAAIRTAGLDKPTSAGPGIPGDSGTTIFTVTLDGQETVTRLSGNGAGGPGVPGGGSGSGDPGIAAPFALLDRLLDPDQTWGASNVARSTYAPTGYRIFVAPGAPPADASTPQTPVAWPLSSGLAEFGTPAVPDRGVAGLRQGAVLGADAATLGPILAKANQATAFTSGGKEWTLYVRPLLPDESDG
jgi:hypothetical protein